MAQTLNRYYTYGIHFRLLLNKTKKLYKFFDLSCIKLNYDISMYTMFYRIIN